MSLTEKTTHEAEGLATLATQYRRQSNLAAFLGAYLAQVQEIEGVLFDVLAILGDIDSQVGDQLDLLGRLVGQSRDGRSDSDYLNWLKARMLVNRSSGTADEILRLLTLILANTRTFEAQYPAGFVVKVDGTISADPEAVSRILNSAKAGGVRGLLEYSEHPEDEMFTLASGATSETSTSQGLGNAAGTTGGRLAAAIEL